MKFSHRVIFFLIFCGSVFTLCGQPLLLQDRQVVVTLGNSITEAGERPDGYVNVMRRTMEVLYPEMTVYFVNAGIGGHKSTDMFDRFERDVLQYAPDWVTISVGVNDVWHGFKDNHVTGDGPLAVPLPVYKEKLGKMIELAKQHNIRVALFTATVIKENLSSLENQKLVPYNQAVRDIAKTHKCVLIDQDLACRQVLLPLQKPDMANLGVLTNDGVHMLSSGNWLMAKTALAAFGVAPERIDKAKGLIDKLVSADKEALQKNMERYETANYEQGSAVAGEPRFVFFGSSSVEKWKLKNDFPGIRFLNRGIGGEQSRQMVLRFRQDVTGLNPAGVIIFLGSGNDFWPHQRMCIQETKANLSRMVRMAQSAKIKVAVGALMPTNDYIPGKDITATHPLADVQAFNSWLKAYCVAQNITFIDFYSPVADAAGKLRQEFSEDGMHCDAKGYAAWKPLVQQVLQEWRNGTAR
jgi:lysophospholipase L1-like esterase